MAYPSKKHLSSQLKFDGGLKISIKKSFLSSQQLQEIEESLKNNSKTTTMEQPEKAESLCTSRGTEMDCNWHTKNTNKQQSTSKLIESKMGSDPFDLKTDDKNISYHEQVKESVSNNVLSDKTSPYNFKIIKDFLSEQAKNKALLIEKAKLVPSSDQTEMVVKSRNEKGAFDVLQEALTLRPIHAKSLKKVKSPKPKSGSPPNGLSLERKQNSKTKAEIVQKMYNKLSLKQINKSQISIHNKAAVDIIRVPVEDNNNHFSNKHKSYVLENMAEKNAREKCSSSKNSIFWLPKRMLKGISRPLWMDGYYTRLCDFTQIGHEIVEICCSSTNKVVNCKRWEAARTSRHCHQLFAADTIRTPSPTVQSLSSSSSSSVGEFFTSKILTVVKPIESTDKTVQQIHNINCSNSALLQENARPSMQYLHPGAVTNKSKKRTQSFDEMLGLPDTLLQIPQKRSRFAQLPAIAAQYTNRSSLPRLFTNSGNENSEKNSSTNKCKRLNKLMFMEDADSNKTATTGNISVNPVNVDSIGELSKNCCVNREVEIKEFVEGSKQSNDIGNFKVIDKMLVEVSISGTVEDTVDVQNSTDVFIKSVKQDQNDGNSSTSVLENEGNSLKNACSNIILNEYEDGKQQFTCLSDATIAESKNEKQQFTSSRSLPLSENETVEKQQSVCDSNVALNEYEHEKHRFMCSSSTSLNEYEGGERTALYNSAALNDELKLAIGSITINECNNDQEDDTCSLLNLNKCKNEDENYTNSYGCGNKEQKLTINNVTLFNHELDNILFESVNDDLKVMSDSTVMNKYENKLKKAVNNKLTKCENEEQESICMNVSLNECRNAEQEDVIVYTDPRKCDNRKEQIVLNKLNLGDCGCKELENIIDNSTLNACKCEDKSTCNHMNYDEYENEAQMHQQNAIHLNEFDINFDGERMLKESEEKLIAERIEANSMKFHIVDDTDTVPAAVVEETVDSSNVVNSVNNVVIYNTVNSIIDAFNTLNDNNSVKICNSVKSADNCVNPVNLVNTNYTNDITACCDLKDKVFLNNQIERAKRDSFNWKCKGVQQCHPIEKEKCLRVNVSTQLVNPSYVMSKLGDRYYVSEMPLNTDPKKLQSRLISSLSEFDAQLAVSALQLSLKRRKTSKIKKEALVSKMQNKNKARHVRQASNASLQSESADNDNSSSGLVNLSEINTVDVKSSITSFDSHVVLSESDIRMAVSALQVSIKQRKTSKTDKEALVNKLLNKSTACNAKQSSSASEQSNSADSDNSSGDLVNQLEINKVNVNSSISNSNSHHVLSESDTYISVSALQPSIKQKKTSKTSKKALVNNFQNKNNVPYARQVNSASKQSDFADNDNSTSELVNQSEINEVNDNSASPSCYCHISEGYPNFSLANSIRSVGLASEEPILQPNIPGHDTSLYSELSCTKSTDKKVIDYKVTSYLLEPDLSSICEKGIPKKSKHYKMQTPIPHLDECLRDFGCMNISSAPNQIGEKTFCTKFSGASKNNSFYLKNSNIFDTVSYETPSLLSHNAPCDPYQNIDGICANENSDAASCILEASCRPEVVLSECDQVLETDVSESQLFNTCESENKVCETVIAESKLCETNVSECKIFKTVLSENKLLEIDVSENKLFETNVSENKFLKTVLEENKVCETDVSENKVLETDVSENKVLEAIVLESKVPKTVVPENEAAESVLIDCNMHETVVKEHKMHEFVLAENEIHETVIAGSKIDETAIPENEEIYYSSVISSNACSAAEYQNEQEKVSIQEDKDEEFENATSSVLKSDEAISNIIFNSSDEGFCHCIATNSFSLQAAVQSLPTTNCSVSRDEDQMLEQTQVISDAKYGNLFKTNEFCESSSQIYNSVANDLVTNDSNSVANGFVTNDNNSTANDLVTNDNNSTANDLVTNDNNSTANDLVTNGNNSTANDLIIYDSHSSANDLVTNDSQPMSSSILNVSDEGITFDINNEKQQMEYDEQLSSGAEMSENGEQIATGPMVTINILNGQNSYAMKCNFIEYNIEASELPEITQSDSNAYKLVSEASSTLQKLENTKAFGEDEPQQKMTIHTNMSCALADVIPYIKSDSVATETIHSTCSEQLLCFTVNDRSTNITDNMENCSAKTANKPNETIYQGLDSMNSQNVIHLNDYGIEQVMQSPPELLDVTKTVDVNGSFCECQYSPQEYDTNSSLVKQSCAETQQEQYLEYSLLNKCSPAQSLQQLCTLEFSSQLCSPECISQQQCGPESATLQQCSSEYISQQLCGQGVTNSENCLINECIEIKQIDKATVPLTEESAVNQFFFNLKQKTLGENQPTIDSKLVMCEKSALYSEQMDVCENQPTFGLKQIIVFENQLINYTEQTTLSENQSAISPVQTILCESRLIIDPEKTIVHKNQPAIDPEQTIAHENQLAVSSELNTICKNRSGVNQEYMIKCKDTSVIDQRENLSSSEGNVDASKCQYLSNLLSTFTADSSENNPKTIHVGCQLLTSTVVHQSAEEHILGDNNSKDKDVDHYSCQAASADNYLANALYITEKVANEQESSNLLFVEDSEQPHQLGLLDSRPKSCDSLSNLTSSSYSPNSHIELNYSRSKPPVLQQILEKCQPNFCINASGSLDGRPKSPNFPSKVSIDWSESLNNESVLFDCMSTSPGSFNADLKCCHYVSKSSKNQKKSEEIQPKMPEIRSKFSANSESHTSESRSQDNRPRPLANRADTHGSRPASSESELDLSESASESSSRRSKLINKRLNSPDSYSESSVSRSESCDSRSLSSNSRSRSYESQSEFSVSRLKSCNSQSRSTSSRSESRDSSPHSVSCDSSPMSQYSQPDLLDSSSRLAYHRSRLLDHRPRSPLRRPRQLDSKSKSPDSHIVLLDSQLKSPYTQLQSAENQPQLLVNFSGLIKNQPESPISRHTSADWHCSQPGSPNNQLGAIQLKSNLLIESQPRSPSPLGNGLLICSLEETVPPPIIPVIVDNCHVEKPVLKHREVAVRKWKLKQLSGLQVHHENISSNPNKEINCNVGCELQCESSPISSARNDAPYQVPCRPSSLSSSVEAQCGLSSLSMPDNVPYRPSSSSAPVEASCKSLLLNAPDEVFLMDDELIISPTGDIDDDLFAQYDYQLEPSELEGCQSNEYKCTRKYSNSNDDQLEKSKNILTSNPIIWGKRNNVSEHQSDDKKGGSVSYFNSDIELKVKEASRESGIEGCVKRSNLQRNKHKLDKAETDQTKSDDECVLAITDDDSYSVKSDIALYSLRSLDDDDDFIDVNNKEEENEENLKNSEPCKHLQSRKESLLFCDNKDHKRSGKEIIIF